MIAEQSPFRAASLGRSVIALDEALETPPKSGGANGTGCARPAGAARTWCC